MGTSFKPLLAPFLIDSYELEDEGPGEPHRGRRPCWHGLLGRGWGRYPTGPVEAAVRVCACVPSARGFRRRHRRDRAEDLTADTLKALGAKTKVIAGGGFLDGADAVEAQLQAIIGNHFQNAMQYTGVNVVLRPRPVVYYANPSTFHALTEKQQQALRLAAQQTAAAALGNLSQVEDAAFAALCANGSDMAVASSADLASLRAAVQPVYDSLNKDPATASAIASIESMKAQLPARAPAHGCPAAAASETAMATASPVPAGFPEGHYEATISAAQMEASWKRFAIPPDVQMQCPCKGGFTLKDGVMTGGDNDRWYYSFFGDHVTIGVGGSANGAFTVRWSVRWPSGDVQ